MTWSGQNTQKEANGQMDAALDYGVNFFDTAELYPVPPLIHVAVPRPSSETGSLSVNEIE
jgi:aryl-alcohol dehydrogenase-like predicted oxidoreductase